MKIECDRRIFLEAIQLVGGVVSTKESDSVLQQVKLQTVGSDSLEMMGTDLEIGMKFNLNPVKVQEEGELVIPAQRVIGILREIGDEQFQLERSEGGCILRCEGSTFKMVTYSSKDFPSMPEIHSENSIELDSLKLREMVRRVIFSTAKESTRYTLNGILFALSSDTITLVATDGKRLALTKEPLEKGPEEEEKIILPAKGFGHLEKIISTQQESLKMSFDNNHIVFEASHCTIFYKLLEGRFPKYEDVIPKNCDKVLHCSRDMLLSKIKQASLLTNDKSKLIRFGIEKGLLKITSHSSNIGEADISMEIEYDGESFELGFNPDYLVDILKIWWNDTFSLEFRDEDTAGLVKDGDEFLYLVMPVSLKN